MMCPSHHHHRHHLQYVSYLFIYFEQFSVFLNIPNGFPANKSNICHSWFRLNSVFFETPCTTQGCTTCGLSSPAYFLKMLSSKCICWVFHDVRDKNAANQLFLAVLQQKHIFFGFHTSYEDMMTLTCCQDHICTHYYSLAAKSNTNIYSSMFEDCRSRTEKRGPRGP